MNKQGWYKWYWSYEAAARRRNFVPLPQTSNKLFSLFRDLCAMGNRDMNFVIEQLHGGRSDAGKREEGLVL